MAGAASPIAACPANAQGLTVAAFLSKKTEQVCRRQKLSELPGFVKASDMFAPVPHGTPMTTDAQGGVLLLPTSNDYREATTQYPWRHVEDYFIDLLAVDGTSLNSQRKRETYSRSNRLVGSVANGFSHLYRCGQSLRSKGSNARREPRKPRKKKESAAAEEGQAPAIDTDAAGSGVGTAADAAECGITAQTARKDCIGFSLEQRKSIAEVATSATPRGGEPTLWELMRTWHFTSTRVMPLHTLFRSVLAPVEITFWVDCRKAELEARCPPVTDGSKPRTKAQLVHKMEQRQDPQVIEDIGAAAKMLSESLKEDGGPFPAFNALIGSDASFKGNFFTLLGQEGEETIFTAYFAPAGWLAQGIWLAADPAYRVLAATPDAEWHRNKGDLQPERVGEIKTLIDDIWVLVADLAHVASLHEKDADDGLPLGMNDLAILTDLFRIKPAWRSQIYQHMICAGKKDEPCKECVLWVARMAAPKNTYRVFRVHPDARWTERTLYYAKVFQEVITNADLCPAGLLRYAEEPILSVVEPLAATRPTSTREVPCGKQDDCRYQATLMWRNESTGKVATQGAPKASKVVYPAGYWGLPLTAAGTGAGAFEHTNHLPWVPRGGASLAQRKQAIPREHRWKLVEALQRRDTTEAQVLAAVKPARVRACRCVRGEGGRAGGPRLQSVCGSRRQPPTWRPLTERWLMGVAR